ncbi:hypothetical protein DFH28DRAFT_901374 [Melampsora americana]|nr:hypothetical protein DFH28DRAFT_901374 [Melampsora americana]
MTISTSSSHLLTAEKKRSDEETTITLPISVLTSANLKEICKRLRLDQTGSRVACLDRIKTKLSGSNEMGECLSVYCSDTSLIRNNNRRVVNLPGVVPSDKDSRVSPKKRPRQSTSTNITYEIYPVIRPHPSSRQFVVTCEDLDKLVGYTPDLTSTHDLITVFDLHQIREAFATRPSSNNYTSSVTPMKLPGSNQSEYQNHLRQIDIRSVQVCDPQSLLKSRSGPYKFRSHVIRLRSASHRHRQKRNLKTRIEETKRLSSNVWWYILSASENLNQNQSSFLEVLTIPIDLNGHVRNQTSISYFFSDPAQISDQETIEMLDTVMSDLF